MVGLVVVGLLPELGTIIELELELELELEPELEIGTIGLEFITLSTNVFISS